MSTAGGRADATAAQGIAHLGAPWVLETRSAAMTQIVGFAEEADYSLPVERAPSSASQHDRSTFSSGKSVFVGLGPIAVALILGSSDRMCFICAPETTRAPIELWCAANRVIHLAATHDRSQVITEFYRCTRNLLLAISRRWWVTTCCSSSPSPHRRCDASRIPRACACRGCSRAAQLADRPQN